MPECDYCGATFDDEDAYLDHLREAHLDELGPIDRRRVGADEEEGGLPISAGPVALVAVVGLAAALVGYVVFTGGSAASVGPAGSAHYHGPINVTVLGEQVDFSQAKYQPPDGRYHQNRFHFEGGDGSTWHSHATTVNLGFGMEALGFEVTKNSFTTHERTYRDGSDGFRVVVEVDGKSVGPNYILQEGDRIHIVVARE